MVQVNFDARPRFCDLSGVQKESGLVGGAIQPNKQTKLDSLKEFSSKKDLDTIFSDSCSHNLNNWPNGNNPCFEISGMMTLKSLMLGLFKDCPG